jgi:hypothetical protein
MAAKAYCADALADSAGASSTGLSTAGPVTRVALNGMVRG